MNRLRKIFIKDYQNINDPKVREKHGLLASICGMIINLILFIFKLLVGVLSFSMSIISDAINNLTDSFSCIVNLLGFKISSMPADKKHPYGHERVEYIAGMIIAFVIIAVSIVLGYESIIKLVTQEASANYNIFAFIVLGVSILLKLIQGLMYRGLGKAIKSEPLKASMRDSFNDTVCTTGVLIAAIVNFFLPTLWWLDPTISLLVALFILYSGIKSVIETANPLIGEAPDPELSKNLQEDILNYDVVIGIHDFTIHSYGHTRIFATIHCEVDGYANIMDIHDQIDNIEQDMSTKYGIELTIHIDPIDTKNKELPVLKCKIMNLIQVIDPCLTIHDLRVVKGPTHTNVLFDVMKDPSCTIDDAELEREIINKVESIDPNYKVIIKVDHKY